MGGLRLLTSLQAATMHVRRNLLFPAVQTPVLWGPVSLSGSHEGQRVMAAGTGGLDLAAIRLSDTQQL